MVMQSLRNFKSLVLSKNPMDATRQYFSEEAFQLNNKVEAERPLIRLISEQETKRMTVLSTITSRRRSKNLRNLFCGALVTVILILFYMLMVHHQLMQNNDFVFEGQKSRYIPYYPPRKNKIVQYNPQNITPPAIILKFRGGIGNQLFQYACHYTLAKRNNWPLYIVADKNMLRNRSRNIDSVYRDFVLDQFQIPLDHSNIVSLEEMYTVSTRQSINESVILSQQYPLDRVLIMDDYSYCQSEIFFSTYKEEILKMFTPKIKYDFSSYFSNFSETESVAVHIRIGDFREVHNVVPFSYFLREMKGMAKALETTPTFYVFSDEINFVEENLFKIETDFPLKNRVVFMRISNSIEALSLMSQCKNQIIPNCSLGWWAAYLNQNPNKLVTAALPNVEYINLCYDNLVQRNYFQNMFRHTYYPQDWIVRDPFVS